MEAGKNRAGREQEKERAREGGREDWIMRVKEGVKEKIRNGMG
jgi:hypothetical protein